MVSGGSLLSTGVQLAVALIASGVIIKVLTLRQDRRKIAGSASVDEANAASVLSGQALAMVEDQRKTAREAEARADKAEEAAQKAREDSVRFWEELNRARWRIYYLETREQVLLAAMRDARIEAPPAPDYTWEVPDHPPPGTEAGELPPA